MQLKTILNRVEKQRSFVYGEVRLIEQPGLAIEVEVRPRANSRPRCSAADEGDRATTVCRSGASSLFR